MKRGTNSLTSDHQPWQSCNPHPLPFNPPIHPLLFKHIPLWIFSYILALPFCLDLPLISDEFYNDDDNDDNDQLPSRLPFTSLSPAISMRDITSHTPPPLQTHPLMTFFLHSCSSFLPWLTFYLWWVLQRRRQRRRRRPTAVSLTFHFSLSCYFYERHHRSNNNDDDNDDENHDDLDKNDDHRPTNKVTKILIELRMISCLRSEVRHHVLT